MRPRLLFAAALAVAISSASPARAEEPRSGVDRGWFWAAFALTAGAVGASLVSFMDAAVRHDVFEERPTQELADEGKAAQVRTQALFGVAAGLSAGTTVLGLFVDWGPPEPEAGTKPAPAAPKPRALGIRGTF